MRHVKRAAVIAIAVAVLFGANAIREALNEAAEVRRGYSQVQLGASQQVVVTLLGEPHEVVDPTLPVTYWDDEILSEENTSVDQEYRYTTFLFFLPRTYVIGFDKNGFAVSKHLID